MTALLPGLTLVPYGVDSWQPSAIHAARQTRAGLEIGAPFPCEAIDCGGQRPLRFNTASYHFDGMPDMTDSGGDAWVYLADLLKRLNRPWDRLAAHFIDRYFAVLEEIVAAYGAELDAELERFAGLFQRRHWLYSAPKPLPRAHLFAPAGMPAQSLDAADYVAVDFAFWTGAEVVAIVAEQSTLTPKKARERMERLAAAGIRTLAVSPARLEGDAARAFFIEALAPVLPRFWAGEPLPTGPFRSAGVGG